MKEKVETSYEEVPLKRSRPTFGLMYGSVNTLPVDPKMTVDEALKIITKFKKTLPGGQMENTGIVPPKLQDNAQFIVEITERFRGRTLTREQANQLIDLVNMCVPPDPGGQDKPDGQQSMHAG